MSPCCSTCALSQSSPTIGYGSRAVTSAIAATTRECARLRIATFSVHPRYTSVAVSVQACSPLRVCPQCATRSISKNPGACSIASIAWRTPIEDRNVAPGRVADFAAGYRAALVGLSIRSIVAGLIATSWARTGAVSRSWTAPNSPNASSLATVAAMIGARYFPHGSPINVHTSISTLSVSYP